MAFALDIAIGDPRWFPHPVRAIGYAITKLEGILRYTLRPKAGGVVLVAIVCGMTYGITFFVCAALRTYAPAPLASLAIVYLASTTLALRGLVTSVLDVFKSPGVAEARRRLGLIVGRDTGSLDDEGIHRAAIETLAENTSDGVIAPLFFLAIGGLPLAMAYKAINTLDSMVGYKNEKYIEFGWASARMDDLANYVPARITGLLMVIAAPFAYGLRPAKMASSMRTMLRDGGNHTSPNSGIPEAAMAGALGLRLGGPSTYGGLIVPKPYIGDCSARSPRDASREAIVIAALTSAMGVIVAASCAYLKAWA